MINIAKETPREPLHGRKLYSTFFVGADDINYKDILDIGCGFGWFELHSSKLKCKSVKGIELSATDLSTAKKYLKNIPEISFLVGSAIKIPFKNSEFDTVVSWEVLEHIPKGAELEMFNEANRVLRAKGAFYLSTPNQNIFACIFDPAWWLIGHRHYSVSQLVKYAQRSGFVIEKIETRGGWWEIAGMLDLYISKWVFHRKPLFGEQVNTKQDTEYRNTGFTNLFIKLIKIS